MSKLLDQIIEFAKNVVEIKDDEINEMEKTTDGVALLIALYAHRDQRRVNGMRYIAHPDNIYDNYRLFIKTFATSGIILKEALHNAEVPCEGCQEVCFLHDVLEDTHITMEDIENIFTEYNYGDYFNKYVKEPLDLITHKKGESYDDYLERVLSHPTSALVKMLDFYDNLNPATLDHFDREIAGRMERYLKGIFIIELRYHFIEKCQRYRNYIKNLE